MSAGSVWEGELTEMFAQLRVRAFQARGGWVASTLPDGSIARMRVNDQDDWRWEMQLAHRQPPADWPERRSALLRAAIGGSATGFDDGREKEVNGGVVVIYRQLWKGEVRPGLAVCPCGAPVPYKNPNQNPICPDCKRRDRQRGAA